MPDLSPPVLCCPDLHASAGRLRQLKKRLKTYRREHPDLKLCLLGDVIDRGEAALETQKLVEEELERGGILLTGNHEAMGYLGTHRYSTVSRELENIWLHNGGKEWIRQFKGFAEARRKLEWLAQRADLIAEVNLESGKILLSHAQVPSKEGWELIRQLSPGKLSDLSENDAWPESPMASWLWGHPQNAGAGAPLAQGHLLAIHGHTPGKEVRYGWAQGQQSLMLDLQSKNSLATALILPEGEIIIETGDFRSKSKKLKIEQVKENHDQHQENTSS